MIDFTELNLQTIQSQYGASPHIKGLIAAIARELDPNADIDLFFEKIFDPETAEGVGLDIWGRIVGAARGLYVDVPRFFLGFDGSELAPFNNAPFDFGDVPPDYQRIDDEMYRALIFYKALSNISDDTAETQNMLLTKLFDDRVAVAPVGVMKVRVYFLFYLTDIQKAILRSYGLLTRGAGVGWDYYQFDPGSTFGFFGSKLQPFNQGIFDPYGVQPGEDLMPLMAGG